MSTEIECLTTVPDNPSLNDLAASRLLEMLGQLVPVLPAPAGVFTTYGRVYCDVGHIELAVIECDSPFLLSLIVEQMQAVIGQAVRRLEAQNVRLVLANNNYSGLLQADCAVWGDHENYLTEVHPSQLTEEILPLLITRIYAGAGAIYYPTGQFLAGARPTCMRLATGGGTTESRAIHSTAREEHHMGDRPRMFRYHGILADGHRSHFNLALQFGCTALALKAIIFDRQLRTDLARVRHELPSSDWVALLKQFNVLAEPGAPLRIHPLIPRIQRIYLAGARRYAASLLAPPSWIPRILADWDATLSAMERLDRPWLAARLDAFAKYEFFSAVLREMGIDWGRLPGRTDCFHELALLDQSYHEFCNPRSAFARIDKAGLLRHRVHDPIPPGGEREAFVPETETRARARSRFIAAHRNQTNLVVDWSWVEDTSGQRRQYLLHPYARRYSRWKKHRDDMIDPLIMPPIDDWLDVVARDLERGNYEDSRRRLQAFERMMTLSGMSLPPHALRCMALLQAQRGETVALRYLDSAYPGEQARSLAAITDYCAVFRVLDWPPDLRRMDPWIERGQTALAANRSESHSALAWEFREHVAFAWMRNGQSTRALELLRDAEPLVSRLSPSIQGRILATLGEIHRLRGDCRRAGSLLEDARELQYDSGSLGNLGEYTYPYLIKAERDRDRALAWLDSARGLYQSSNNLTAQIIHLALEARIARSPQLARRNLAEITSSRSMIPVLRRAPILDLILDQWDDWVAGAPRGTDEFWGL